MGELQPICFRVQPGDNDPGYSRVQSDPLVVWSAESALRDVEERLDHGEFSLPPTGRIVLPLAPDKLHKHGYSGDDAVGLLVPDSRIDGLWSEPRMSFIKYMRMSLLDWGGFPGFRESPGVPPVLEELRGGLVAF
jgi:hypothetical protein